jgi:hypothetical protein
MFVDIYKNVYFIRGEEGTHHFLTYRSTGLIAVKDRLGRGSQVSKDDPRWLSGELVGVRRGATTGRAKGAKDLKKRKPRPAWKVSYMGQIYDNAKIASKEVGLSLNRVRYNCKYNKCGWSWA